MLKWMRQATSSWLVYIAIGAIVVVFIFWGVGSYRASSAQTVAVVNGVNIPFTGYVRQYNSLVKQYQERAGSEFNEEMAKNLHLKEVALNQLIEEVLILEAAKRMGCEVTDAELRQDIQNYPAFQKDGKFDETRYFYLLNRNRLSPQEFEAAERQRLMTRKIVGDITAQAKVSDLEVEEFFRLANETVAVNYLEVKPEKYLAAQKPNDSEIGKYYQEHPDEFRLPERARVNYLLIPVKDYLARVKTTPAEVAGYLKEHQEEFQRPKVIRVRQLFLALPPEAGEAQKIQVVRQAQELVDRLKAGEDFGTLAASYSQDAATKAKGGDLGDVTRGQNLPDWEKVAFGLKPGTVGVAPTNKGLYLIKVEEVKETEKVPDAEKLVTERLDLEKARNLAKEAAGQARQELSRGLPAAQVALKFGVKPAEGVWLAANEAVPLVGAQPKFNRAALELKTKQISPIIDLGSGFAVIQEVAHESEHLPTLEQCQDKVRLAVQKRQAARQTDQEANRMLAELRQGKTLSQVAAASGLTVQDSGFFTRYQGFKNQRQAEGLTSAAFQLTPKNPYPDKPVVWEDNYYLLAYKAKKEGDPQILARERDGIKATLLDQKRQMIFASWLSNERQQASIKVSALP